MHGIIFFLRTRLCVYFIKKIRVSKTRLQKLGNKNVTKSPSTTGSKGKTLHCYKR